MKITIDIGHPAHVHYFRNFIKIMQEKGHEFLIFARDKEITHKLLNFYKIPFINRGKGYKSLVKKLGYLLYADLFIYKHARKFKPDLFLSFTSPYAAHAAKLLNKPHISFTDTEHAALGILSFAPFTKTILTPSCFKKDFGSKHIRFNGYMELCYLHPKYYSNNNSIRDILHVNEKENFVLLRFVSWNASHDIGQFGIPLKIKIELVKLLSKKYKVFISSEEVLPNELENYKIQMPPERIHDAIFASNLFIGESGTMATEAAILGTPSVFINSLDAGVFQDEVNFGLLYSYRDSDYFINNISNLIADENLKQKHKIRRNKMLTDKIDVTAFMIWFIENYPSSVDIMRENPDYQKRFK